jgi:uncharacterized protein (TIGR02600 family)
MQHQHGNPAPAAELSNRRRHPSTGNLAQKNRRGVSLIVVLGCIVFLSALILAFLSGARTELRSSRLYADGSSVRLLAQSAVNIVTAEIGEATKSRDGSAALTWASQPGMIRTYGASGTATRGWYKLYSAPVMTGSNTPFDPEADSERIPANWASQPAVYTDLNQPVTAANLDHYPIIDGNGLAVGGSTTYPDEPIAGFHIDNAPGASASNPVPMPVHWLYVLADGRIVAPAAGAGGNVARIDGANAGNPIVGRMAFWTDDETAKLNINTAAEGTFWDTPRVASQEDLKLARNQPAQKEFQRYPGHPAMVSLSTVFKQPDGMTDREWREELYRLVPRVTGGGSEGGEVALTNTSQPLRPDTDRLFASVDELWFKPLLNGDDEREINDAAGLTPESLARSRFFLTASSRAPDLNLFGLPRVSIWPVTLDRASGEPQLTPYDQLLAFCATVNGYTYYFKRQNSNSAVTDLGLDRNQRLLDYLRRLTGTAIPGFGGSFQAKYSTASPAGSGTDCDQILTAMFDYIRSTNLKDTSDPSRPAEWGGQYARTLNTWSQAYEGAGLGQVVPIYIAAWGTRGFGRFPTVQSVALHFIGVEDATVDPPSDPNNPVPAGKLRVRAGCYVQMFNPSLGQLNVRPHLQFRIEGLETLRWGDGTADESMGFAASYLMNRPEYLNSAMLRYYGGTLDFRHWLFDWNWQGSSRPVSAEFDVRKNAEGGTFHFSGGKVKVTISAMTAAGGAGEQVQEIEVEFPSAELPLPELASGAVGTEKVNFRSFGGRWHYEYGKKYPPIAHTDTVASMVADDLRLVAARRSVGPGELFFKHPDYGQRFAHTLRNGIGMPYYGASGGRLVENAGYAKFLEHYNVNDPDNANPTSWGLNNNQYLTKDAVTVSGTGVFQGTLPGDWDTGVANLRDGPYINKADDGDVPNAWHLPYYGMDQDANTTLGSSFFSPNRLIPSAGMFGSLPSEVFAGRAWQTLLFRPGPAGHRGLASPPDWLLLDLFQMPVLEPYAISEPLSTAGRINMNFQIVPFTYINRDTGLRAVLKAERIMVIPNAAANRYKSIATISDDAGSGGFDSARYRWPVDLEATLEQFRRRFAARDIFHSAAEICSIDLVPLGAAGVPATIDRAGMDQFWRNNGLTGDNLREKPYADLYPLLTTQSNTFTVHLRVQTLQKSTAGQSGEWDEARDKITGEYRGSQTIERYVDPNADAGGPVDYAAPGNANATLDAHYHFRVVNARQFAP